MDSSELTRRRVNQLFYTNYLFQQTRVNGGCSNRVQLQTLAGGGAMDASLIPVLKNGEIGTTIPQYQQIVESSACPS